MNYLVTGASSGIGYELALQLTQNGHNVLALARNASKLETLKEKCSAHSGTCHTLTADVNSSDDLIRLISKVENSIETVDVLINNAGHLLHNSFEDFTYKQMLEVFNTNFFSVCNLLQFMLPYLQRSEQAHVINIGSMGGFQGSSKFPGLSIYSASKAALANLTECLAEEWKEYNIKVNCLALGSVNTEMLQNAFPGYEADVTATEMAKFIADFSVSGRALFNGKVVPVALNTP